MLLNNINEVCIAIDIAILGIAYPIIVDKISNIGDKYSSNYLAELFKYEFPQQSVSINFFKWRTEISLLKLTLFVTILTFVFQVFDFEPLFGWDNLFINNSAHIIIFISTAFLTISFFIWLDKVVLFSGKTTTLLSHIQNKHNSLKSDDLTKKYYLKAINEISIYALNKPDTHVQESLIQFYSEEFSRIRRVHDKTKPLVYPYDLYELVFRLNQEIAKNENEKLPVLEHRAVSGLWLLGQDFEEIVISEETYNWLWKILNLTHNKPKYIKSFWSTSHQYFEFQLKPIDPEYDYDKGVNKNDEEIIKRKLERKTFLEFHYALGSLLLYSKQYSTLNYLLKYSQSEPPRYVLLPDSTTDIFKWFDEFSNDINYRQLPIDIKYFFPELDNLGNRNQVNYWFCSYLSLLFIRLYTLRKFYTFQNFTSLPQLPNNVNELKNWYYNLSFFEKCLNDVIHNSELINALKYEKVVEEKNGEFKAFVIKLRKEIVSKFSHLKRNAPISDEKVALFNKKTKKIISESFKAFNNILVPLSVQDKSNLQRMTITGGRTYVSKSGFTNDDVPLLNFDSFFASEISTSIIKKYIPQSFLRTVSKRYLLNYNNLLEGIERLKIDDDFIIVAVNAYQELLDELKKSAYKVSPISSTHNLLSNTLFILKKSDLPSIEHVGLTPKEIIEDKLNLIENDIKLYTSVIEDEYNHNLSDEDRSFDEMEMPEVEIKIKISIAFLAILSWNKERNVVQINIETPYREQGIPTRINDITSFNEIE